MLLCMLYSDQQVFMMINVLILFNYYDRIHQTCVILIIIIPSSGCIDFVRTYYITFKLRRSFCVPSEENLE